MIPAGPVIENPEPPPPVKSDWTLHYTTWRRFGVLLLYSALGCALANVVMFQRFWSSVASQFIGLLFAQFLFGEIILLNRLFRRGDREVLRRWGFHTCFVLASMIVAFLLVFTEWWDQMTAGW